VAGHHSTFKDNLGFTQEQLNYIASIKGVAGLTDEEKATLEKDLQDEVNELQAKYAK